jgi:CBS domain-containing protein
MDLLCLQLLMLGNKCSGLPVVDLEGRIVANVSISDIHRLSSCANDEEVQAMLSLNVLELLRRSTHASMSLSPLCLETHDTLATALELMTASGAHRVYIIHERKPVGVLTMSTIMRALVRLAA